MQRDQLLLAEIVEAVQRIIELTSGRSVEDIETDRDRRDALLWNFTVLGEAAARLSETTRAQHPEVPWGDPVRLRNRIVHGYWSVDLDVLLATANDDLPTFLAGATAARASLDPTGDNDAR